MKSVSGACLGAAELVDPDRLYHLRRVGGGGAAAAEAGGGRRAPVVGGAGDGGGGDLSGTSALHFRWKFPEQLPLIFPGTGCLESPSFWTGSSPGTTIPPEVPAAAAVLPVMRDGALLKRSVD